MANGNGHGSPEDHILPPPGQQDDGTTEMAINPEKGKIVVRFREPRHWVVLDPSNAAQIGKHLIDCAVACGAEVAIQVPRREVSREKREALVARAMHIIRSTQEQNKPLIIVARSVVDQILSAIE